jgi:ATP-dependent exoDNAse (exonuclease V) alpha subunit
VVLPRWYAGEHLDYAYAVTVDRAQGMTVDQVLFAAIPGTPRERTYVALSRGRHGNHIYAVKDSGWQDSITEERVHTFASQQKPDRAQIQQRILEREQLAATRRAYRQQYLRERGLNYDRDRDDGGRSISM